VGIIILLWRRWWISFLIINCWWWSIRAILLLVLPVVKGGAAGPHVFFGQKKYEPNSCKIACPTMRYNNILASDKNVMLSAKL
jgi:hypothetical protein